VERPDAGHGGVKQESKTFNLQSELQRVPSDF
jgi:hypothetical protein